MDLRPLLLHIECKNFVKKRGASTPSLVATRLLDFKVALVPQPAVVNFSLYIRYVKAILTPCESSALSLTGVSFHDILDLARREGTKKDRISNEGLLTFHRECFRLPQVQQAFCQEARPGVWIDMLGTYFRVRPKLALQTPPEG